MAHFSMFAPEKITYAIDRYQKEVERVFSVLESVLSKQEWLAADRVTIADIAFYPVSDTCLCTISYHNARICHSS